MYSFPSQDLQVMAGSRGEGVDLWDRANYLCILGRMQMQGFVQSCRASQAGGAR